MREIDRSKARELRSFGYSIKQIAKELNISSSTISLWTRDIELTEKQKDDLLRRKIVIPGQLAAGEKRKVQTNKKREALIKEGFELAKIDDNFRIICALYWGEGAKTSKFTRLTNSDPKMINLFCNWLTTNKLDYKFVLYYHKDNWHSDQPLIEYWKSKINTLTSDKIRKSIVYPVNISSKNKKKQKCLYGTVNIDVKKSSSLLYKIFGGIDYLASKM